ncbi:MAG: hypothetical protein RLZZ303_950 [Candidatus Hydrogenedentota bacterium]|jgi:mono/diheme cytochrome c family protein
MKTSPLFERRRTAWAVLPGLVLAALPYLIQAEEAAVTAETALESVAEIEAALPRAELPEAAEPEDTVAVTYMLKCMGCHTIGGGALSGPDLKASAGYPRQTVVDAIVRMEKNVGPMAPEEMQSLTEFLLDPSAADRLKAQQQKAAMKEAASLEPASADKGRALFFGRTAFQAGGIGCAACHQAGGRGGNLAASLEDSFTRLGEQSLMATTQNPGFPVMRAIYANQPVTKQEAVHIAKYLEEVSKTPADPANVPLHLAGLTGTVIVMVLLGRATHKRAAGTRARMVADAQSRANRRIHSRRDN